MNRSYAELFRICQLFFGEMQSAEQPVRKTLSAQKIARQLAQEGFSQLSRQAILPKLVEAYGKGMIRLIPPRHQELQQQLAEQFDLDADRLWVVNVDDESATRMQDRWAEVHVAAAAADLVLEQIKRLRRENQAGGAPAIGLGLGPGRATLEFSQFLSQRLRADPAAPDLTLMAITGGSVPLWPQYAPLSFFNLFPAELVKESVGLFAEMLVPHESFEKSKTDRVGIKEAYKARNKVDIVVTAMGDFQDDHDLFKGALTSAGVTIEADWVGNVQYRPYSATKPILQGGAELRAVTLFELRDFVRMAHDPAKCVVLIARRCGVCGRTKAAAVRPLLEQPELRVFSHLVMDLATAKDLVKDKAVSRERVPAGTRTQDTGSNDKHQRQALTFWLCDAFFNRYTSIQAIKKAADGAGWSLAREAIYPRLAKAASAEPALVEVVKPLEMKLVEVLSGKFDLPPGRIRVVDAAHLEGGGEDAAAAAAAEWVLTLAKDLAAMSGKTVGLGLGPGRATLDFSLHLGRLLCEDREAPKLDLIAISAGCVPEFPKFAAESFFNLFPKHAVQTSIGLFAETLVTHGEYQQIVADRRPGVKEAFDKRDQDGIDILVTAIGDFQDEHDLMGLLLESAGNTPAPDWIGSVQHRPYDAAGPVREGDQDLRAVTLFELADLVQLAKEKGKHVVLIARQCRQCGRTRAPALRPLLTEPKLRVWSELVMDVATARELVRGP